MLNKNVTIIIRPECYLHCPNLTIDVYFMRNQELTKELNAPPPGSKDLYFQTQYSQPSLTQTKACVLKQYWSKWRYPQDNAIWFLTTIFASCLVWFLASHWIYSFIEFAVLLYHRFAIFSFIFFLGFDSLIFLCSRRALEMVNSRVKILKNKKGIFKLNNRHKN